MYVINKKILHIITLANIGGATSVVINLVNKQCEQNDVYIISSYSYNAWSGLDNRVHIITIKELQRNICFKDIVVAFKLLYWRFKINPDIVHLHSSKMGMFGRLVFLKRKIIYTIHGFDSMRVAHRKLLWIEKLLKNRCRFIAGICQYDIDNLKVEGIQQNVVYIPNGVEDISKKIIIRPNQKIIDDLKVSVSEYSKVIVTIARDEWPKRIDLFIELAKAYPQYAFIWVGNIKFDYEIPKNMKLLGQIPQGYQLLNIADAFVLCSNYEGMPMSILEALSMSKPVVASDVGGVSEILDGMNGYAVENRVDCFKEALDNIFESEDTYQQYAQHARESYVDKYCLDVMVNGYDEVYSRILG